MKQTMTIILVGMFFIAASLSGCALDVGPEKYLNVKGSLSVKSDVLDIDSDANVVKVEVLNGAEEESIDTDE